MPEPKFVGNPEETTKEPTSVMGKMYKTLGRKFSKKNVNDPNEGAAGEEEGMLLALLLRQSKLHIIVKTVRQGLHKS